MLVLDLLKPATLGIGICSAWNMVQMNQMVNEKRAVRVSTSSATRIGGDDSCDSNHDTPPLCAKYFAPPLRSTRTRSARTAIPGDITLEEVLADLKGMNRKDLIRLFLASSPPSKPEGEWNAILLDNNGWVMSSVSRVITNGFFGKGRVWNGKKFSTSQDGINRFRSSSRNGTPEEDGQTLVSFQHEFDWTVLESPFYGGQSLSLDYSNYQNPLSLWKTMKDEVRALGGKTKDGKIVMLGMGSMAWSGGMLNASPFCLYAKDDLSYNTDSQ